MSSRSVFRPRKVAVMRPLGTTQPPVDWCEAGPALVKVWAPAPRPGRHLRRIQRRAARIQAGDFTLQLAALPAYCADLDRPGHTDRPLKRMYRKVLAAHRTRSCTW